MGRRRGWPRRGDLQGLSAQQPVLFWPLSHQPQSSQPALQSWGFLRAQEGTRSQDRQWGGGVAMEPVLEETLTVNSAHSHLEGAAGAFQSS